MTSEAANTIAPDRIPYAWIRKELTIDVPLRLGSKGAKVKIVQEWLSLSGQHVSIDGVFGPATERAVSAFQESLMISGTGIVDEDTFGALTAPMLRALTPVAVVSRPYNALVVAYAEQHLAEHPLEIGGQNQGPWVRLYTSGNQGPEWAWCAGFVSLILRQAADTLKTGMPFKATVSCDTLAAEAKEKGVFVSEKDLSRGNPSRSQMSPGSIFLNRRTETDWIHTGLVTAFREESFETIEGNTNDAGDREGYEVCKRIRGYTGKDFVVIA